MASNTEIVRYLKRIYRSVHNFKKLKTITEIKTGDFTIPLTQSYSVTNLGDASFTSSNIVDWTFNGLSIGGNLKNTLLVFEDSTTEEIEPIIINGGTNNFLVKYKTLT